MLIRVNRANPDVGFMSAISNMLRVGQLIIIPTDTIYGIGASALSKAGVIRLFSAKKREQNKPLGIFVSNIEDVQKYCHVKTQHLNFLSNIWPGSITCVFQLKNNSKLFITPNNIQPSTIAVRIPKSLIIHSLLQELKNPILQTSANISGQEHLTFEELKKKYYRFADVMIDAGAEHSAKPSTVISLIGNKIELLREGSTPWNDIKMYQDMIGIG